MINVDDQSYTYPVLGSPGAYLPPHDEFELEDYKFSKSTAGNMHVEGTLRMKCGLLEEYLRKGVCKAYLLTWNYGRVYRRCHPMNVGSFSLVLEGAALYADSCRSRCMIVAETDIPDFFNPACHNAEYGAAQLDIKRGMPLAVSHVVRTKKKADSVGSAIKVKPDPKLDKKISFRVECDGDDDYIYITARPGTKKLIDRMHKNNRTLFDNVVLAPVLVQALKHMSECRESAQWASVLAEKCQSIGITQEDIDEQPHAAAQKLLYKDAALFERLKWGEGSGRATGGGRTESRENGIGGYDEEDDYL